MERHELPFPAHNDYSICRYLQRIWEAGWLDEYSENHFIIKALENTLESFVGCTQMLNNDPNMHGLIKDSGIFDNTSFNLNFCMNLSGRLEYLDKIFGGNHIERFIKDQLSAGKAAYNEDTFFEALSELCILYFYACRSSWKQALYEPPVSDTNSRKNPEAKFVGTMSTDNGMRDFTINIEVKCPKFPEYNDCGEKIAIPTVLLSSEGRRVIPEFCKENEIRFISPRVMKLKDFLNSAANKFTVPKPNEYNLLYINWSYCDFPSNSYLEAWSLLTNTINGILTHPDAAQSIGVSPDVFTKISAVIVYTEALEGLMFLDFRFVWQTHRCGPRFRMWILDDDLRVAEMEHKSNGLFEITGMQPDNELTQMVMVDFESKTETEEVINAKLGCDLVHLIKQHTEDYRNSI